MTVHDQACQYSDQFIDAQPVIAVVCHLETKYRTGTVVDKSTTSNDRINRGPQIAQSVLSLLWRLGRRK